MNIAELANTSRTFVASLFGPLANTFQYQFGKLASLFNMHFLNGGFYIYF